MISLKFFNRLSDFFKTCQDKMSTNGNGNKRVNPLRQPEGIKNELILLERKGQKNELITF